MRIKLSLFILLVGVVLGCQSPTANPEGEFLNAFRQAHQQKDVDAAMKLVYLEGVESDIQQNFIGSFKDDFSMEIEKLEMVLPPENQMTQYTQNGRTFKTNLDVKKVFVIHFRPQPGPAQTTNTEYLIGEKDGKYLITTAVPMG